MGVEQQQPLEAVAPDHHNGLNWAMTVFISRKAEGKGTDAPARKPCWRAKKTDRQGRRDREIIEAASRILSAESARIPRGSYGVYMDIVIERDQITVAAGLRLRLLHEGKPEALKGRFGFSVRHDRWAAPSWGSVAMVEGSES